MPVDTHLQWNEIRDFSGGLWNRNGQLGPPNAFVQMDDCFPAPSGGLKAWFKPTTFTTSGIADTTNERARFLHCHENVDGAGNNVNYLLTYKSSDGICRLYEMNEVASQTTWHNIKTFATGSDPSYQQTCTYVDTAGNRYLAFGTGNGMGTDNGLWTVLYNAGGAGTVTKQVAGAYSVAFNYQSRLCAVLGSVIHFSDAGLLTNISTNTAPVDIAEGQANILMVATFSPGDLLVFKEGAPIYLVEGDLNNYTVRQMNGSKAAQIGGNNVVRGPQGVIFRAGTDGIYETPDGSMLTPLSQSISQRDWQGEQPMSCHNHWLFCATNGHIFDYDSHAWFNTTFLVTSGSVCRLPRLGGFFFVDNVSASPMLIWKIIPQDGRTDNRAETFTIKTGPLRDANGRQMEIRAIQVYARSFNGATSTVTVTVNGVPQTAACDASGRGNVTFYFLARKEELDITMTCASNAAGVCAPDIEALRFAGQPGHFTRPPGVG
jgi:hypothetical protein